MSKASIIPDQLALVLTAEWYNKIEAGKKKEEYRTFNMFWAKRLCKMKGDDIIDVKTFKTVKFSYGYGQRHMIFECKGIFIDTFEKVVPAECVKGETYFTIELGERIK